MDFPQAIRISKQIHIEVYFMVNQRTIEEILGTLPATQKETVQNLRNLIRTSVPETVEVVKNGKILYRLSGKDFVWISHFQDHVDLEFAMGASLDSSLLKSRGAAEKTENVRHISIGNFDEVKFELARLLKQAALLGFEHCPAT
jgi:hypothetical protein